MTDIVETVERFRLRANALLSHGPNCSAEDLILAADTIERLEQTVSNQRGTIVAMDNKDYELRAENEKLRLHLNHIASCKAERLDKAGLYCEVCDGLAKDAIDALEDK